MSLTNGHLETKRFQEITCDKNQFGSSEKARHSRRERARDSKQEINNMSERVRQHERLREGVIESKRPCG